LRESKKEEAMPASKRGSGYESGRYLTPKTQRRKKKKGRNEEGFSIEKIFPSRRELKNLFFSASLRLCVSPKKKRQCPRASVDQVTNQEGISRQDAKTQRKKEEEMKKASPSKKTSLHGVN
jgi:hypothetical protein